MINKNNTWLENNFVKRMQSLNRINLLDLYPSESWALNFLINNNKSFLDLGCGDGNKFDICKISKKNIIFKGIDLNEKLIKLAKEKNKKFAKQVDFECIDVSKFLLTNKKKYDVVMAWAFFYTLPNYKEIIKKIFFNSTKKYLVFDLRISDIHDDIIDLKQSYTFYDNKKKNKCVYVITSYKKFVNFLKSNFKGYIKKIYMSGYDFKPSKHVKIKKEIKSPSVCTVIIEKGKSKKSSLNVKLPFINV